jgi:hypothetical protein
LIVGEQSAAELQVRAWEALMENPKALDGEISYELAIDKVAHLLGGDHWDDIAQALVDEVLDRREASAGASLTARQEAATELAQIVAAAVDRAYDPQTGGPELQGRLNGALEVLAELSGRDSSCETLDGLACIAAGY